MNADYAIYSVIAPMIFLVMWKHSMAPCLDPNLGLVPADYIAAQVDVIVRGVRAETATATANKGKKST